MKKSLISIFIVSLVSTTLFSCGGDTPKVQDKDISIIYTTDVHCAIDEDSEQGYLGYAKVEAYKKSLQETNYVALVDSGDYLQGEFIGAISKGEYVMEVINEMNYDVITLGNHEFDYGMDILHSRLTEFEGDVVSCNISYTGHKENKLNMVKPYVIKEYGIKKVAFLGITTPKTLTSSDSRSFIEDGEVVYDFGAKTEQDFYNLIQSNIDKCKAEGADYVIALSHLGSLDSYKPFSSIDVIENTTGVTAFLDGHAHADLPWTTKKNKDNEDTYLVDTGYKLNEFASFTIKIDGTFSYDYINEYEQVDPDMDAFVKSIKDKADKEGKKVVANIDVDLDGEKTYVRTRETPLGDLIADAYRYCGESDIGVVNGGGIRDGLKKGDVTYEDIMNVHPFGNKMVKKKTTGSKIRDYLEFVCRNVTDTPKENPIGGFAQVSGIRFKIDTTIESTVVTTTTGDFVEVAGDRRVKDIQILENDTYVDLVDAKTYTITSHEHLLDAGGGGAIMFKDDETVASSPYLDYELLVYYIVDVLKGHLAESYSKANNRITIIPEGGDDGRIITVNKDMLYNAKLYDYRHPDKEYSKDESDKKFTIDVGNGKYIEGAIIFRDCGHQYVGETLLDAFGIKNTSNTSQAYNFNILFYFDKLSRFDVAYTTHATVFNWIDYEIKFARDDKLTEDDFYSSLNKVPYKQIYEHSGGNYGDTLFPGGNTAAGNYYTIKQYVDSEDTVYRASYWALTEGTSKLVGLNFTKYDNYLIESRGELDFKLTSLQFYYYS
ncbi:MAG: bifunctional metallophosphatase/5'-nucleotidase [Bacilli bacterium]|nr:bifunctional metallophosphatase/5'-nucleotidase [Bacilli bacterium]